MQYPVKTSGKFRYIEKGQGPNLLLIHGLMGALSNWGGVVDYFSNRYRVFIPLLPISSGEPPLTTVEDLSEFILEFMDDQGLATASLIGNSLGGHIGLLIAANAAKRVETLTLTGSSGLYEAAMGGGFIRRGDYDYIKERCEFTFYEPKVASEELIQDVFELVNNRPAAMRVVRIARDAQRMNMSEEIKHIHTPTCLIWGLNDNITPPKVAHEFHALLPNSELHFLDRCGHAPMMERKEPFNRILDDFLQKHVMPVEPKAVNVS